MTGLDLQQKYSHRSRNILTSLINKYIKDIGAVLF